MAAISPPSSGLRDYVGTVRRRLPYVVFIAPPILLLSVFFAYWLKPQFESTATLLLRPSTVNKDVIESTVATTTDEQIEVVAGRVLTPESLLTLVQTSDPYPEDKTSTPAEKAQRLLQATTVETVDPVTYKPTTEQTNAFSVHYRNSDPALAANVASGLAQLFVTYQQRQQQEISGVAATFLRRQAADINAHIAQVDGELAKLKTTEGDALPELRSQNQAAIDEAQRNLEDLQQQIIAAQSKESLLSAQLAQTSPNLMAQSGDLTDVATVRAKLAEAEQIYTPNHPEVIRLKRALKLLMEQGPQTAPGGIDKSANNPQYQLTATELQSARRDLASLRAQSAVQQTREQHYDQLLRRTPAVELKEADILRRRQALQDQYQQIQTRLQNAEEAQNFESGQHGERFIMLRAPSVPASPAYPNRAGVIALGLLLALGLAGVAVAAAESTDPSVRNAADLPQIEHFPLLAAIPMIHNSEDRLRRRMVASACTLAYAAAIIAVGIVVMASRHTH